MLQDVCMPELNGLQLLSCVKQDANLRAVPVVSESCHSCQPASASHMPLSSRMFCSGPWAPQPLALKPAACLLPLPCLCSDVVS